MGTKKSVEVVIGQQRLSLKTDQDPARVTALAEMVNERLSSLLPFGQPLSHQVLLLLAMTLADDLRKSEESSSGLKAAVKEKSQKILTQLEREFSL